ncbi:cytochrome b-c1 complex subunit 7, mitochondrial [Monosporozyma servazzii]
MPQSFTSIVKIGDYILKSPTLSKVCVPVAKKFVNLAGYRKLGLRYNDLLSEENPILQTALRRLPEDESYSRNYRIIRAHQQELTHQLLPRNEWVKATDDANYLMPYILEAEAEAIERDQLDNLEIKNN